MRLISQLINDISRVLQKLLKHFNSTIISTSFAQSAFVSPITFRLNLEESLLPGKVLITPVSFKYSSSL